MKTEFQLEEYLSNGVEHIITNAIRSSLSNPEESLFMAQYALSGKKAAKLRKKAEESGEHIPPFLICSITSNCNLHCKGCYARANHACHDAAATEQLSGAEWNSIFAQASELGIGFALLAGGEPLLRIDVIKEAARHKEMIFPIFTNGTMIGNDYVKLFQKNRNLLPVISIEGNEQGTDLRRGTGIYQKLQETMCTLQKNGIFYGASVTVTTENLPEVFSENFVNDLYQKGCKVIFYVEYVPVAPDTKLLAPQEKERTIMAERLLTLRKAYQNMLMISFPGDEKSSGGCLAAGRGFFHINSHGGAEPCPFSPYSDTSLKQVSLREALHSPLFLRLQKEGALLEEHTGGCVLFEKEELVKKFAG